MFWWVIYVKMWKKCEKFIIKYINSFEGYDIFLRLYWIIYDVVVMKIIDNV